MVMELNKKALSAEDCLGKLPDLLLPCSSSSLSLASKLNAHAPEFVPSKHFISAQILPQKTPINTAGLQHMRENRTADATANRPCSVYASARPLQSVRSKNSLSAVSKSPKNQGILRTESLQFLAEDRSDHEDLKSKIVKLVEFYFSDANLATDNYLMKLLKKDPEGFVPISVVSSFSKIKSLVKNHGVVAAALKTSSHLELSKDGKKIRRTKFLPDMNSKEVQARTVVAENLPENHSTDNLTQLFGSVGNVQMVRICQPGTFNKHAATEYLKTDMLVSNKLHALVVYECIPEAEKAVTKLTDERNWRTGLRVRLLLRRTKSQAKIVPKGIKTGVEVVEGSDGDEESASSAGSPDKSGDEQARVDTSQKSVRGESIDTGIGSSEWRRGKCRDYGWGRGRGQLNETNWSNGGTPRQNCSKFLGGEVMGKRSLGPRMPDGTRGFTLGRGRLVAACAS